MQIDITEIEAMAYRLIRRKARDLLSECTNEQLGEYVHGIVDLQTELYAEEMRQKS